MLLVAKGNHPHPLRLRIASKVRDRDTRDVIDCLNPVKFECINKQVEPIGEIFDIPFRCIAICCVCAGDCHGFPPVSNQSHPAYAAGYEYAVQPVFAAALRVNSNLPQVFRRC